MQKDSCPCEQTARCAAHPVVVHTQPKSTQRRGLISTTAPLVLRYCANDLRPRARDCLTCPFGSADRATPSPPSSSTLRQSKTRRAFHRVGFASRRRPSLPVTLLCELRPVIMHVLPARVHDVGSRSPVFLLRRRALGFRGRDASAISASRSNRSAALSSRCSDAGVIAILAINRQAAALARISSAFIAPPPTRLCLETMLSCLAIVVPKKCAYRTGTAELSSQAISKNPHKPKPVRVQGRGVQRCSPQHHRNLVLAHERAVGLANQRQ